MAASSGAKKDSRKYGTTQIHIKDLKVCHVCSSSPLSDDIIYCPNCGFPQRGTEYEQRKFIIGRRIKKSNINEEHASVGIGRGILFFLGIVNGLVSIIPFRNDDSTDGVVQVIIGLIYFGLGFWAIKKPFPALLTGLIVYVLFILLQAMIEPSSIFSGLVFKSIIISSLVYGMSAVKKAEKLQNELELKSADLSELNKND